jgi:hypothetical protein
VALLYLSAVLLIPILRHPGYKPQDTLNSSKMSSLNHTNMAYFATLPTEILLEIVSRVATGDYVAQKSRLARLSLCCRRLHSVVEPILYSSFKQVGKNDLIGFLGTIWETPRLAEYVLEFKVTGKHLPQRVGLRKGRRFEYAVRRVIEDAGGCTEDRKAWFQGIKDGQRDAILAAALATLPRVQRVDIDIPGMPGSWGEYTYTQQYNTFPFIKEVLGRVRVWHNPVAPARLHLQSLTSLTLRAGSYPENTMDQCYVLPFLEAPSLRRIEFQNWSIYYHLDFGGCREEIPFSITDLSFRNCIVSEYFHHFLRLFPKIERLSFGYTADCFGSQPFRVENRFRRVSTALREDDLTMRKHLKEFRLEIPSSIGTESIPDSMFYFIKDLEVLEVLDIPAPSWITKSVMVNWSKILPPSIRVLTLHCSGTLHIPLDCTVHGLVWLLREKNRYVPNLEVIILVDYVPRAEFEKPKLGELAAFGMLWENHSAVPSGRMYRLRFHADNGRVHSPGPQWELVDVIES